MSRPDAIFAAHVDRSLPRLHVQHCDFSSRRGTVAINRSLESRQSGFRAAPSQPDYGRATRQPLRRCLHGSKIDAWESFTAEFIDCVFAGRLRNVRFYGRPWGAAADKLDPARTVNAFSGNDFRKADLVGAIFIHGIDVKKQLWPASTQYVILDRIHQRIAKVRVGVLEWSDHRLARRPRQLNGASLLYAHRCVI